MAGNVALMGTEPLGASQKAINLLAIARLELIKVGGDVDHVAQTGRRLKYRAGSKKLACASDRRK
jgi:hypothetical protein